MYQGFLQVYYLAAATANEVMVMSLPGDMIADAPFAEIGFGNEIQLFQQLQSAIDGGYIGVRIAFVQLLVDVLGADVPVGIVKCLNDQHALRSQPVPIFPKNGVTAHFKFTISPLK
jgi:hypothetical protein